MRSSKPTPGLVQRARAEKNTTGSAATATCVVQTVRRFRFNPGAEGSDVTFGYALTSTARPADLFRDEDERERLLHQGLPSSGTGTLTGSACSGRAPLWRRSPTRRPRSCKRAAKASVIG